MNNFDEGIYIGFFGPNQSLHDLSSDSDTSSDSDCENSLTLPARGYYDVDYECKQVDERENFVSS